MSDPHPVMTSPPATPHFEGEPPEGAPPHFERCTRCLRIKPDNHDELMAQGALGMLCRLPGEVIGSGGPPYCTFAPADTRKPYSKPVLRHLGSVRGITMGSMPPGHMRKHHG